VVVAANFNSAAPFSTDAHSPDAAWISRYSWFENADHSRNTDYHDAVLMRLRNLEAALTAPQPQPVRTWSYVDTGPIVERVLAKYAGIGWIARNTCIIREGLGSFLFLGVILTSIELPSAHVNLPAPDRCGSCTRCIEACPTQAITAPYELDPRRCISYLTIEKRGEVPAEFEPLMGRQIFGCDICQDVCPWNGSISGERPQTSDWPEFSPRLDLVNPDLNDLARLTPETFQQMFRRSPIKRAKYEGFMRNVAVALGNSDTAESRASLELLARHENPVIAAHAQRALARRGAAIAASAEFPHRH
jgi:epoxyqueuosine reductase